MGDEQTRPQTIDEAIEQALRRAPAGGSALEHREALLWKFIELLAIYDGPVTIYPDKQIHRYGSLHEYELMMTTTQGIVR
jgi:hypothetical protein